jgi:hypothetical protein
MNMMIEDISILWLVHTDDIMVHCLLLLYWALAIKTADGVNPFSFNVFFISPSPYVFRGKVDENLTVPTSYEISSEHTHSATSTSAIRQLPIPLRRMDLLDSEGKVLVMGPFDVRTCNLVSGFSDDLTAEEGLAVVAVTTAGAFPSRNAFSLADLSARSFLSA